MNWDEQNAIFSEWLGRHAAVVHHVANGFAEGADRDDLMQELLLALWRAVPAFRGGAQTSTFIYRVAHNAALMWTRGQRSYRERIERFEQTVPGDSPVPQRMSAATESEALTHVYAAIRALPALDRSLILLQLDGLTYAEIAAMHGLTESNVGARLTRLRQQLAATLEDITHELR